MGEYEPKNHSPAKVPDIVADPDRPRAWVDQDPKQPPVFNAIGSHSL
jgi:hypothetical protein